MTKLHRTIVIPTPARGPHLHARGAVRNGSFTLIGKKGCQHEAILRHAPQDCRADLETLISLHLRSYPDGVPMHALSNLVHAMRGERFDEAAAGLAGAVEPADVRELHARILERLANEPLKVAKGADPSTAIIAAQDAVWRDEARSFIEERCAARWKTDAQKGIAALSRPDSHPDLDPHESVRRDTFAGFLCVNGITMRVMAPYPERATGRAMGDHVRRPDLYACELEVAGKTANTGFFRDPKRSSKPLSFLDRPVRLASPGREECLRAMQHQFAALDEAGEDGTPEIGLVTSRPRGEDAPLFRERLSRLRSEFVGLVGPELYREFMEEVGPNPPHAPENAPRH